MPSDTVVIIGASNDRSKFGNKAVRAYRQQGWTVYPVNPHKSTVEGLKSYRSILDVPRPIHRVSMYVPPTVGLRLLDEIAAIKPDEVFLNPGSESPELVAKAEELGLNVIAACSITALGMRPADVSL